MQPLYLNKEVSFYKKVFIDLNRPFRPKTLMELELEEHIREVA